MNWIRSLFSRLFRPQWCIVIYVGMRQKYPMYESLSIYDYYYSKKRAQALVDSRNNDRFVSTRSVVYEVMERDRAERLEMQKAMEDCE